MMGDNPRSEGLFRLSERQAHMVAVAFYALLILGLN